MELVEDALSANEAFYDAFGMGDVDAMFAIWAKEAPVTCLHPGWAPLHGRDAVLQSWRGIMESPERPVIQCEEATAKVHGDTAIVLCYENLRGGYLLATNIFVREDGLWRMVHHQAGGPVNPPDE